MDTDVKPIRWGILGCGAVVEKKSGPALMNVPGSTIAAVMCRSRDKAEGFARRFGVPKWYNDADALIQDQHVDAVYIATPPGMHAAYAIRVAEAGKPAYVEKPFARNAVETQHVVDLFVQKSLPLFVAYYRRALPRFTHIKRMLQSGVLGKLQTVKVTYIRQRPVIGNDIPWRFEAEHSGGGLFMDVGCHTVDILDFLLGDWLDVQGAATRSVDAPYRVEDYVVASWRYSHGVVGHGLWNMAGAAFQDEVCIRGSDGELQFAVFGDGPITLRTPSGESVTPIANPDVIQWPLIETMVAELRGTGRCPSRGDNAYRAARVMDEILKSYYLVRDDAFWSRGDWGI